MFAYLDFLFLSYRGRIGRGAFWLGLFVIALAQLGAIAALLRMSHGSIADLHAFYTSSEALSESVTLHVIWPILIVTALFIYPTYALYAKRCHDRNKSGWFTLLGFIPLIGLWVMIELGFLGGDDGENAYGAAP